MKKKSSPLLFLKSSFFWPVHLFLICLLFFCVIGWGHFFLNVWVPSNEKNQLSKLQQTLESFQRDILFGDIKTVREHLTRHGLVANEENLIVKNSNYIAEIISNGICKNVYEHFCIINSNEVIYFSNKSPQKSPVVLEIKLLKTVIEEAIWQKMLVGIFFIVLTFCIIIVQLYQKEKQLLGKLSLTLNSLLTQLQSLEKPSGNANLLKEINIIEKQVPKIENNLNEFENNLDILKVNIDNLRLLRENEKFENKKAEFLSLLASQVAHDVRSPLAALDMIINTIKDLPEDKRILIRNSVGRIRDIANDLLNKRKEISSDSSKDHHGDEKTKTELLQSLLDPLITEKRLQYRSKLGIEIHEQIDSSGYGLFAAIQPTEFKRVLSNLINNSVEAFTNSGIVTITLRPDQKNILVEIKDNGKGIPEAVLAKLGARGETHGKEGGSGLGFYHAKKSVEAWGGTLTISSQVGKGTIVTINLPQTKIPHWFVPKLIIYPAHQIVVLDDDSSIHQIWQGRFDSAINKKYDVNLLHFSTEEEIKNWKQEQAAAAKHVTYLVDYELIGQKKSGLDIIETLGIAQNAILVTSRYEEEGIRRRCEQLGIKMIPKGLAGFVPIEVAAAEVQRPAKNYENCDCVLIDDDALVRMTWGFAAKDVGKILKVFSGPKEFFEIMEKINPQTPIYIDSHLGEGINGEEIAQVLFEKHGFCEIYLATGYSASDFDLSKMPYLKGIIGKDNPWV